MGFELPCSGVISVSEHYLSRQTKIVFEEVETRLDSEERVRTWSLRGRGYGPP